MAIKSKKVKRTAREKVKSRIRKKIVANSEHPRISVFRSSKHIYAQVISDTTGTTLAAASTLDKDVVAAIKSIKPLEGAEAPPTKSTKSKWAARAVGLVLAQRCLEKKVESVVFDRNGFIYSGRVQSLADGAREGGLKF